jgi:signal-transduction protein with cAMP-binding, CBS, and nucleotidyltransferase domain
MKMSRVLAEKVSRNHPPLYSICQHVAIRDVAQYFQRENIGAAMVEKENPEEGFYVGIITAKDIIRCIAETSDLDSVRTSQIMTQEMITADINDDVSSTVRRMREHHVRHIPLKENGKIIALISVRDLMHCIDMEQDKTMSNINDMFGARRSDTSF